MTKKIVLLTVNILLWSPLQAQWLDCPRPYDANCASDYYTFWQLVRVGMTRSSYAADDTVKLAVFASDGNANTFAVTREGTSLVLPDSQAYLFNFYIVADNDAGDIVYDFAAQHHFTAGNWQYRIGFLQYIYVTRTLEAELEPGSYFLVARYQASGYQQVMVKTSFIVEAVTDIALPPSQPLAFRLEQNFPNPFNAGTSIIFSVPQTTGVRLAVFNTLGQCVATVYEGASTAGVHSVNFSGSDLPSGLYICRLTAGSLSDSKKMFIMR